MLHERENNQDTESFLQENIDKFQTDAVFLLGIMLKGEKLTAKTVVQKYGKEPRRLRDLFISGKCKKQWKLDDKGKRLYVEYYCEIPLPPTKQEAVRWATEFLDGQLQQGRLL